MNAKGASAVLMDADSGEIVSLSSLPDFDPNNRPRPLTHGDASDSALFNRAVQGVYELGFSGNKVSLFENYFNPSVLQSIEDSSITSTGVDYEGADYLYLKGGEGSMAIIELFADDEFGNTYEDYLNEFRDLTNGITTVEQANAVVFPTKP